MHRAGLMVVILSGVAQLGPMARSQGEASEPPGEPPRANVSTPLRWRLAGPANMEGRVTDLAVVERRPSVFYVATASGGLWKTENGGTTFACVFDGETSSSIGAVAVSPSAPDVVWIGTGEANARNSVGFGDGVYKSEDAGKTWSSMGLPATRHIGRIAIHPTEPDVVFVAALGSLWGPNPERGLFKTGNGGRTWAHVLRLDEDTGCVDVAIDPKDPSIVYCAAYAVRRDAFDGNDPVVKTGPRAGFYKSTDGGTSWRRLESGLPSVRWGRSGLHLWRQDPRVLYAVIETELTGKAPPAEGAPPAGSAAYLGIEAEDGESGGVRVVDVVPDLAAAKAGLETGDVIVKIGAREVADYEALRAALSDHRAGETVWITFLRREDRLETEAVFGARPGRAATALLGGQAENRHEEQGGLGHETGGVFRSDDGGETWRRVNSLNPRPFYFSQVRVDPGDADRVYVLGISLHVSADGGRTFRNDGAPRDQVHVDHHALWIDPADPRHLILGNDGGLCLSRDGGRHWEFEALLPIAQFYGIALDQRMPYRIFGGTQDNGSWCVPSLTRKGGAVGFDQVFQINGGDGFVCAVDPFDDDVVFCESQFGNIRRVNVRTGASSPVARTDRRELRAGGRREPPRFHWKTPFVLSPHNGKVLTFAGEKVYRSIDGGRSARVLSPVIALTERGSATALAESPAEEGVLWVGTDDGALHVTRDAGRTWTAVHERLPGLPGPRAVSHIEASRFRSGRCYVVVDAHRSDDLAAYIFKTADHGATFEPIVAGLPRTPCRVLREDPRNPDLLYLGTESGAWFSRDAGASWEPLGHGLPTVPVHDLAVHVRDRELVAGTHGRSLWILDVAPLQDLSESVQRSALHVFAPKPAFQWERQGNAGRLGHRRFEADDPGTGSVIWYWCGQASEEKARIQIEDLEGRRLRRLEGSAGAGLNGARWSLDRDREGRRRGGSVPKGTYRVRVSVGDEERVTTMTVAVDPASASEEESP